MSIDLAALLRRHKPERRVRPLPRRNRADLPAFDDLVVRPGTKLMLDTGIYIAEAAGSLASERRAKLARIERHHCTVCLGEIAVGLANRDVSAAKWPSERDYWQGLFAQLPVNRTYAPDAETWAAAGILAGTLTRLQGCKASRHTSARTRSMTR